MPRLHTYRQRHGQYVLTEVDGMVVSYQLTAAGEERLAQAGITAGEPFDRALLLDLYRTGDAYALGNEFPEAVLANQLPLDFAGDPHPASAFPVCDGCRQAIDLHLSLSGQRLDVTAQLQCPHCRASSSMRMDTSIPLRLLSRSLVTRLFESKQVVRQSENVVRYLALLDEEFQQHWARYRTRDAVRQAQLFSDSDLGGLGLT
jgi:hypothetical protein